MATSLRFNPQSHIMKCQQANPQIAFAPLVLLPLLYYKSLQAQYVPSSGCLHSRFLFCCSYYNFILYLQRSRHQYILHCQSPIALVLSRFWNDWLILIRCDICFCSRKCWENRIRLFSSGVRLSSRLLGNHWYPYANLLPTECRLHLYLFRATV